jgi:predicted transcriptional regulator
MEIGLCTMSSLDKFIKEDLSSNAKIVYLYLERFYVKYGKCYPRHSTIAKDLNFSRRTIIRCLNELRDKKFIVSKRLQSSCAYRPNYLITSDVPGSVYIKKPIISKSIDISKIDISRHSDRQGDAVKDILRGVSRQSNLLYKSAVKESSKKNRIPKKQRDKLTTFLNNLSSDKKAQFWREVMDETHERRDDWLKQFPQLVS